MVASLGTSEKLVVNHFVVQIVTQQRMRCGDIVSSYSIHAKKKGFEEHAHWHSNSSCLGYIYIYSIF